MSRNNRRRHNNIGHYVSIFFAVVIGVLIGTGIGVYNYTVIRSCLNGNVGACLILRNR